MSDADKNVRLHKSDYSAMKKAASVHRVSYADLAGAAIRAFVRLPVDKQAAVIRESSVDSKQPVPT